MTIRSAQNDALTMGLLLGAMAACSAAIGGLGLINYLNGEMLKAMASLVLPVYLGYWAWQARGNLGSEPLIAVFTLAWLCGLPIGLVVHSLRQMLA